MEVAMPASFTPCLDEIDDRLKALGVAVDPNKVASAVLSIAVHHEWEVHPEQIIEWIEALAVEVAHSWPKSAH
jgi:hypothetical protein